MSRHGVKGAGIRRRDGHAENIEHDTKGDKSPQNQKGGDYTRTAQHGFRGQAQRSGQSHRKQKDRGRPTVLGGLFFRFGILGFFQKNASNMRVNPEFAKPAATKKVNLTA